MFGNKNSIAELLRSTLYRNLPLVSQQLAFNLVSNSPEPERAKVLENNGTPFTKSNFDPRLFELRQWFSTVRISSHRTPPQEKHPLIRRDREHQRTI